MKTKIGNLHIDLSEIAAIGALRMSNEFPDSHSNMCTMIFPIHLKYSPHQPFYVPVGEKPVDPYKLDGDENDEARKGARDIYNAFVASWTNHTP